MTVGQWAALPPHLTATWTPADIEGMTPEVAAFEFEQLAPIMQRHTKNIWINREGNGFLEFHANPPVEKRVLIVMPNTTSRPMRYVVC